MDELLNRDIYKRVAERYKEEVSLTLAKQQHKSMVEMYMETGMVITGAPKKNRVTKHCSYCASPKGSKDSCQGCGSRHFK